MTVLLVGYDLYHKEGAAYEDLETAIKGLGSWWHCLDSTWFVDSESSAADARDKLTPHLGKGDKLLVVKIKTPTAWAANSNFPANCIDWLKDNVSGSS
jgi:hypothetical protein